MSIAQTSTGDFIVGGLISGSTILVHVANTNGGLDLYMAMLDSNGNWDWVENQVTAMICLPELQSI